MNYFLDNILPWILRAIVISMPIFGGSLVYNGLKSRNAAGFQQRKSMAVGFLLIALAAFILLAPVNS